MKKELIFEQTSFYCRWASTCIPN